MYVVPVVSSITMTWYCVVFTLLAAFQRTAGSNLCVVVFVITELVLSGM